MFSCKQTYLSKFINNYKTVTSRLLKKEFANYLRQYYFGNDKSTFGAAVTL